MGSRPIPAHEREEGFTLVELMVVVLVLGILIGVALPTFLGARTRAADRAAQANLRTALTVAMVVYTQDETFTGADAVGLTAGESSLRFSDATTPSTGAPVTVSVAVGDISPGDAQVWGGAQLSTSGTCWYITTIGTDASRGTYRNSATLSGGVTCTGDEALVFTTDDGSW